MKPTTRGSAALAAVSGAAVDGALSLPFDHSEVHAFDAAADDAPTTPAAAALPEATIAVRSAP